MLQISATWADIPYLNNLKIPVTILFDPTDSIGVREKTFP